MYNNKLIRLWASVVRNVYMFESCPTQYILAVPFILYRMSSFSYVIHEFSAQFSSILMRA